jgi:2-hydroxychromene-2-carboxylate isomerase
MGVERGDPMAAPIAATLHTDPGCPWAYSAIPALRVMRWRYGDQLDWRLVMIGLTEDAAQYVARGYTGLRSALGHTEFRDRFGMPFAISPKERPTATARACRAVVAARIDDPGREWDVLRTLQLAQFTTPILLDRDEQLAAVLRDLPGIDGDALVGRLDDPDVSAAYQADRAEARAAAGTAAELQGKTAATDGPVRFTAPTLVLERDGLRLVAGGWQPVEAYDVIVANLGPELRREEPPDGPEPLLRRFPEGLTTREVARLLVRSNDALDEPGAERALLELVAAGRATRRSLGQSALWTAAG